MPRSDRDERVDDASAAASPSGRLDDQLCFALYAAANAMQRTYAPLLKPLGLTYLQYLVLLVLWESGEGSVGDIGRRLFLDSGTLTPVLQRLAAQGLVTRRRSAHDERTVLIDLTERGAALETEMDAMRIAIAGKAGLDGAAFATLREELHALRARLVAN